MYVTEYYTNHTSQYTRWYCLTTYDYHTYTTTTTTIIIIIIKFLTEVSWASITAPFSTKVRTISTLPFEVAQWRAVYPTYNNNEEMRHENKINCLNYIYNNDNTNQKMMMMVMMMIILKVTIIIIVMMFIAINR